MGESQDGSPEILGDTDKFRGPELVEESVEKGELQTWMMKSLDHIKGFPAR